MEVVRTLRKNATFNFLYVAHLLISFHLFVILYINSSFLASFVGEQYVGLLYVGGALLAIATLFAAANLLHFIGNFRALIALSLFEMGLMFSLALFPNPAVVVPVFILHVATFPLILFGLDILLESYSKTERSTGNVRGIFLSMQSIALILSPLIVGLIVGDDNFWKVYILSAVFIVPFIYIILRGFKHFSDPPYDRFKIRDTLAEVLRNRNLYGIFMAQFIMRFFFSWMVIYAPIYLHEYIGFAWEEIGVMFTIMLLPYLIIEYPAGRAADSRFGEKEMLILGFVIAAISTAAISLSVVQSFVLWTIILLFTRIGASLMEIATESYFFKHVDGDDANTISAFRMTRPFAYVMGPITATLFLSIIDFRFIFIILALILLYGIRYSLIIKDTR